MHGNGQLHQNGTAPRAPRPQRRLAAARVAAGDLRVDAGTWLQLRGERFGNALRRAAWRLLGWVLLAFVLVVAVGTATVLLLAGAAGALADTVGCSAASGAMIVAAATFVSLGAVLALGRRGVAREEFDQREQRLRSSMRDSARRLSRSLYTVPGLLLVGIGGFVSARALRDRRLRRLLLVGWSTMRSARRFLATEPTPLRPGSGDAAA